MYLVLVVLFCDSLFQVLEIIMDDAAKDLAEFFAKQGEIATREFQERLSLEITISSMLERKGPSERRRRDPNIR